MGDALLKSVVLFAFAMLVGACGDGQIGGQGSPYDPSIGEPRADVPFDPGHGNDAGIADETPIDNGTPIDNETPIDDGTPIDQTPPPPTDDDPNRPWAHNTGPSDPAALVASGAKMITTDGVVLENIDVRGDIWIDADDVTVRNFRIDASGMSYGINVLDGHSGVVIEDGEIYNMSSAAILGTGFTARRLHIHDSSGDAIKAQGSSTGPTLVEYCFIEKLGSGSEAHADGDQTRGGSDITFRYNNIFLPAPGKPGYPGAPYKTNAAFMLQLDISNFVIENNWLNGGNYTIYCQSSGIYVRNNIFGTSYEFGPVDGNCTEWSGNVREDTGDPI